MDFVALLSEFVGFLFEILMWIIFWFILFRLADRFVSNKINSAEKDELINYVANRLHRIKQEKHGEVYYWFDADTDAFLGQGKTDDEVKEHLKQRFKGHVFLLDDDRALAGPDLKLTPIKELKMLDKHTIA